MTETTPTPTLAERDAVTIRRLKAVAAWLLLLLAGVSFTAGIPGLLAAGGWAQLGQMAWLLPILIDGGLVFSAIGAMAWRAETGRAAVLPWLMVLVLSATSVAAQITHVLTAHGGHLTPEAAVGATVASLFPLVVLASTRSFELLRFGQLVEREARRASRGTTRPRTATRPATAGAAAASKPRTTRKHSTSGGRIPESTRQAVLAHIAAGNSQNQAAAAFGVSRGAVQAWVREADAAPESQPQAAAA